MIHNSTVCSRASPNEQQGKHQRPLLWGNPSLVAPHKYPVIWQNNSPWRHHLLCCGSSQLTSCYFTDITKENISFCLHISWDKLRIIDSSLDKICYFLLYKKKQTVRALYYHLVFGTIWFAHILQGYFAHIRVIIRLPRCQRTNPKSRINTSREFVKQNVTKTQQNKTKYVHIPWDVIFR